MSGHKQVRCAVYTRKSSEEGLDQSFNSLHAQREACEAYVLSQKHEGWEVIEAEYDDGGFSGGNMDRPGLKKLLADIAARQVDTVVVYKVDRLTRSLADFAKIVEQFDGQGVSFVSVTQQFNTTSSMGRLTLNVLLSFAQFEREVTGERIRDKIAASKRKGMWMGGTVPLGYDLRDRALVINETESEQVREIYRAYLELGCVLKLRLHLEAHGIRSKKRLSRTGNHSGAAVFSRGSLYELLQNPLYIGEVRHKEKRYPGKQPAILDRELWDQVQKRLIGNRPKGERPDGRRTPALLMGLLFDSAGNRFTPSHTMKKGRRYNYYVSQATIDPLKKRDASTPGRVPAKQIEGIIITELNAIMRSPERVANLLSDSPMVPSDMERIVNSIAARNTAAQLNTDALIASIERVVLDDRHITIHVKCAHVSKLVDLVTLSAEQTSAVTCPATLKRFGGEMRFAVPTENRSVREASSLLRAVVTARDWLDRLLIGKAKNQRDLAMQEGVGECYVGQVLGLAFLAPDIIEMILSGCQPERWNLLAFIGSNAMGWEEQRAKYFASCSSQDVRRTVKAPIA